MKFEIYIAFLLNSQAQGVSGKNEQCSRTPWRGAQCSCIGCIGLRPALLGSSHAAKKQRNSGTNTKPYHCSCYSMRLGKVRHVNLDV